jgi:hypothetical protein
LCASTTPRFGLEAITRPALKTGEYALLGRPRVQWVLASVDFAPASVRPTTFGTLQFGPDGPLVVNVRRDWPDRMVTVAVPAAGFLDAIVDAPAGGIEIDWGWSGESHSRAERQWFGLPPNALWVLVAVRCRDQVGYGAGAAARLGRSGWCRSEKRGRTGATPRLLSGAAPLPGSERKD